MRKLALVATLVVLLVPFFAAASFARNQVIRCAGIPCMGTGNGDLIYERAGNRLNDKIYLKGGSDKVRANRYTRDRDLIYGSTGYDLIYVNDGDTRDRIRGGKGRDKCYVDAPWEAVRGCSKVIVC